MTSRQTFQTYISFLVGALLLFGCASPIPPTGGPKDAIPPKIDPSETTVNYQVNFQKQDIFIGFDEWVQLDDPFNKVVISPPLDYRPEIKIKGRGVMLHFADEEELRPNTTYTVNFGDAVKDITEGNIVPNLSYVFSTGSFIDSLQVSGLVINAETGEPEPSVLLLLQDNLTDTAIQKVRPSYFAKTNKDGLFQIQNIRNDTFQVFTLKDVNLNYLFDQEGEWIGFLDTFLILLDPSLQPFQINIFEPKTLKVLEHFQNQQGNVRIALDKPEPIVGLSHSFSSEPVIWLQEKDTVRIWYPPGDTSESEIYLKLDEETNDTIYVNPPGNFQPGSIRFSGLNATTAKKLHPQSALEININTPLISIQDTLIRLIEFDSISITDFYTSTDSTQPRKFMLENKWNEASPYEITILPGAITDIFGQVNDTIRATFKIGEKKNYGNIMISTTGLEDSVAYILHLLKGQEILFKKTVENGVVNEIMFANLLPTSYKLRLIEDINKNGKWDTGNLQKKRQPEKLMIKELEPLRAGWDMKITLNWNSN